MMIQVMSHVTTSGLFTFYKTSLKIFFYAVQYNEWVFFLFLVELRNGNYSNVYI